MQRDEACGFVRDVFACPADVAEQVVDRGRIRAFARTAVIVRQGDWLTLTYLLFVGRAHALLYGADGQIVLVMSHRPSALAECNLVMIIDGGQMRGFGPRDERAPPKPRDGIAPMSKWSPRSHLFKGFIGLAAGLGGFALWAMLSDIRGAVVASGQ
eukprot:gene18468-23592_t